MSVFTRIYACIMPIALLSVSAVVSSATEAQTSSDVEFVHKVVCSFNQTATTRDFVESNEESVVALASSLPTQDITDIRGNAVIQGQAGARFYVLPETGGVLKGQFLAVYADGQSVRVQIWHGFEKNEVNISTGHCEVLDQ